MNSTTSYSHQNKDKDNEDKDIKRLLTQAEIDDIVSVIYPIRSIPQEQIRKAVLARLQSDIRSQLSTIHIYPSLIGALKARMIQEFRSTQIDAGESIGVLTAQSIGERQTQLTLDSFHSSGTTIETVVSGVPRFAELLNTTKKPKCVLSTLRFNLHTNELATLRNYIGIQLKQLKVSHIVDMNTIRIENASSYMTTRPYWYRLHELLQQDTKHSVDYTNYSHVLTFKCNLKTVYENRLTLADITPILNNVYGDIYCVNSPYTDNQIDIWVSTTNIEFPKESNSCYFNESRKDDIYIRNVFIPNLLNIHLFGIEGIEELFYKQDDHKNWYIETLGSNLREVLSSSCVNQYESYCNNMWEIYSVFGIEAVREFLVREFVAVISVDSYINERHILLLVDIMTYTGNISSISRYGVHRNQSGPLSKSSFEECLENFLKAGIYADVEDVTAVSASIMVGKPSKMGTGVCELIYNPNIQK